MLKKLNDKNIWCGIALILSILLLAAPVFAQGIQENLSEEQQLLRERAFMLWQRMNAARRDPLGTAQQLGVSEETVRATFSDQPWVLEQGLPPLAWNDTLSSTAARHGRDMLDRHYYSKTTPDGLGPAERMLNAGCQAYFYGETLNALFFFNFIPLDFAFDSLVDAMLRDELTGNPKVQRNIFLSGVREVGVSFFAEAGTLFADSSTPYLYLFVVDFAAPMDPQRFLIGTVDAGSRPAMKPFINGIWHYLPLALSDEFQVSWPDGGANVRVVTQNGYGTLGELVTLPEGGDGQNIYVDLRSN